MKEFRGFRCSGGLTRRLSIFALLVLLSLYCQPVQGVAAQPYSVQLRNLFLSHGVLEPEFKSNVFYYTVNLLHAHDQLAITPEIDQSLPEYQGGEENLPLVTLTWNDDQSHKPESASIAIRRQIDLPEEQGSLLVTIKVMNPHNQKEFQEYFVTINQSSEPVVVLKGLEATDDLGNPVLVEPLATPDDVLYTAYVHPDAESVFLNVKCAKGNWVTLDSRSISNGSPVVIPREKDHHRQLVQLTCGKSSSSSSISKTYLLSILSNFDLLDIPPPRLIVNGRGKECDFSSDDHKYRCPNPRTKDYRTRLTGFIEPSVRYTVESSDKTVQVRILDEIPTIPFTYTGVGDLSIVGLAGQHNVTWPLVFQGAPVLGVMHFLGWLLGLLLLLLLLSLLSVLGLSNMFGIGTPIGVTEIATAMTLLLQFFCFASALRGPSFLTNMTDAMKWVTLYWPLPWNFSAPRNSFARWGDVADLTNAYGCLFWAAILFSTLMAIHGVVAARFKCSSRASTFPHRLAFGNWESRCLHWLSFPVATSVGMIMKHADATSGWRVIAGAGITLYFVWAILVFVTIKSAVSSKFVLWVWHNSTREDGELEDEAGFWSDVLCDQLLSQPVNRSLCKCFFPWRWVSTVADIHPVRLFDGTFLRNDEDDGTVYPPNEYQTTHKEGNYPLGKNPKTVEIYRTMRPTALCPGQRLIGGLLRSQWLDILFTYEGLTQFHTRTVQDSGRPFGIPLTVKTCQLTGPITGGPNHFFYDGARVPFVRIGDTFFRLLIGIFMGVSLASDSYTLDAGVFGLIAVLGLCLLIYHLVGVPYARRIENWMLAALLFSITCTSIAFTVYSMTQNDPSLGADVFLWLNAVTSVLLAAYAAVVIFSVYSAIMCPPLEETRFLEKLANCNVTISDHDAGWAVDVPAYNKYGARDLKAQCSVVGNNKVHVSVYPSGEEPTIEFDAQEMVGACLAGTLRPPVLSLFCPDASSDLGYRHLNVYDHGSLHADVAGFMAMERSTRYLADSAARNIAHQVESRARGKTIISLTIIPPRTSAPPEGSSTHGSSSPPGSQHPGGSKPPSATRYRSGYTSVEMSER